MSTVVSVNNLSKKYIILHDHATYTTLRDQLSASVKQLGRSIFNPVAKKDRSSKKEEFWALRNVSFHIQQGERLGIIGRNGAGKSTLLKLLSRITDPTSGSIRIKGRVASLLEVGTGFHPELTGRENIFLNGAILGMNREEIKKKFDEIVHFAEVEKFLDTPVKRYSTGMWVRLAFAVAAHLEPEILIVDEVLAVGDAQFQKKCLSKMESIGAEGNTVLFVSHNMGVIEQLCSSCMLLDKGALVTYSENTRQVINQYLFNHEERHNNSVWVNTGHSYKNPFFIPLRFYCTDMENNLINISIGNDQDITVNIEIDLLKQDPDLLLGYALYSEDGTLLYWTYHKDQPEVHWPEMKEGRCRLKSTIPRRYLNEGGYRIELMASTHFRQWFCEPGNGAPCIYLTINGGLSDSPYWMIKRPGLLAPEIRWFSETI